jgi:hypothetical protein
MTCRLALALLTVAAVAACSSTGSSRGSPSRDAYGGSSFRDASGGSTAPTAYAPQLDSKRKVVEQDCSKPVAFAEGNLRCR